MNPEYRAAIGSHSELPPQIAAEDCVGVMQVSSENQQ
jgi:hypothetical protein